MRSLSFIDLAAKVRNHYRILAMCPVRMYFAALFSKTHLKVVFELCTSVTLLNLMKVRGSGRLWIYRPVAVFQRVEV